MLTRVQRGILQDMAGALLASCLSGGLSQDPSNISDSHGRK